jgi:DNA-binding LacI/PurR family transcriptional regulator
MRVCQQRGLRVPEDIAIVGFDDIAGAAHSAPSLTTIAIDKEALGRRGVELLLEESPAASELSLPVRLIARGSTAAAVATAATLNPVDADTGVATLKP